MRRVPARRSSSGRSMARFCSASHSSGPSRTRSSTRSSVTLPRRHSSKHSHSRSATRSRISTRATARSSSCCLRSWPIRSRTTLPRAFATARATSTRYACGWTTRADSSAKARPRRTPQRWNDRALGAISQATAESFFDVFLAFRDLESYDDMIRAADAAPAWLLASMPVLREQFALALNRTKVPENRRRATQVLEKLIAERGDNPETSSLLGRVWKDQYVEALAAGEARRARTVPA